jgi:acyl-CoA thioester hydrolase
LKKGKLMLKENILEKKIYYHDTDAGGVVYYANYLKHLEEGRTELCLMRGVDTAALAKQGIYLVVSRVEIDYKAAACYGDTVKIVTKMEKMSRVAMDFLQSITREDKLLIKAKVTLVCVTSDFKLISIPDGIKKSLQKS